MNLTAELQSVGFYARRYDDEQNSHWVYRFGNIAGAHAIRMAKIPEIEIAALCDIDPDAFARLHQRAPNTAGPPTLQTIGICWIQLSWMP